MEITSANLRTLNISFNAAFQGGLRLADPLWQSVVMEVKSNTAEEEYGWLSDFPIVREWLGPRQMQNLAVEGYKIRNRDFEQTVAVRRPAIEDDQYGVYAPRFTMMGQAAGNFPNKLVFDLVAAGFATNCYDGQYFFDTDHPVMDSSGVVQSVSNSGGGAGAPWFLLDLSQAVKPIILQRRKPMDRIIIKDQETDDHVFKNNEIVYGCDGRMNVGYGLWQLGYGSKQTLDAAAYATARSTLAGFYGNGGVKLGTRGTHLVVGPTLESAARTLLTAATGAAGASNPWFGTAQLVICPWL